MIPHVRLLVGWYDGRSTCLSLFPKRARSYTSMLPLERFFFLVSSHNTLLFKVQKLDILKENLIRFEKEQANRTKDFLFA